MTSHNPIATFDAPFQWLASDPSRDPILLRLIVEPKFHRSSRSVLRGPACGCTMPVREEVVMAHRRSCAKLSRLEHAELLSSVKKLDRIPRSSKLTKNGQWSSVRVMS